MFADRGVALDHIAMLVERYNYRPLGNKLSMQSRALYEEALPDWCRLAGAGEALLTPDGTQIATGYRRVVIGDYGAFIEFDAKQALADNLRCQPGQEYRLNDPNYRERVKYHWLTATDGSGIKIYFQQRTVRYADYLPEHYYVSPYEATPLC